MADDEGELKAQATETQPVPADIPKGELEPLKEAVPEPLAPPPPVDIGPREDGEDLVLEDGEFDAQGEDEELLFGATFLPDQPMTQGSDFGPGADGVAVSQSPAEEMRQVAERFLVTDVSDSVRAWAVRVAMGL